MDCTQQVKEPGQVASDSSKDMIADYTRALSSLERDLNYSILSHRKILESSFYVFPDSPEENKIQKARAILGEEITKDIKDEDMAVYLTQFQYLLEGWLDIYEKQIFNGITLQQLLQEG